MDNKCMNCTEKCPQAERAHQAAMGRMYATNEFIELLKKVENGELAPVVHGEWSTIEDDYVGMTALQCSMCNQEYWFEDEPPLKIYNYCPNCGAKMDGVMK